MRQADLDLCYPVGKRICVILATYLTRLTNNGKIPPPTRKALCDRGKRSAAARG